jgi:ubiquinone/menaquinone biosynthesis C-methylase UbiE
MQQEGEATSVVNLSGFGQVDATNDPSSFVTYLDAASATGWVRAYKLQAVTLLGVQGGDRVLDVGCGVGEDARMLARLVGSGGLVVGLDSSETMVREATRRSEGLGLPLDFRQGDVHRLEFEDSAFDRCRADRVLQHLEDPDRALAEMVRVVRPGGRLVVSEPDWETLVIDAPNPDVTRKITALRGQRIRNARIGRQLRARLIAVGLHDVVIYAESLIIEEYAQAKTLLGLVTTARAASEAGVIGVAEADAWIRSLEDADRQGRFFASATVFTGGGTKPVEGM